MSLREGIRAALQSLAANRLRAGLTTLGVLIGVLSVVLLVAIGQGARSEVTGVIESLGSNLLFVLPGDGDLGAGPARSRLQADDVDRLARGLEGGAQRVAGYTVGAESLQAEGQRTNATVLAVTPRYPEVVSRQVARGQPPSETDVATSRRVVALGASLADDLFGDRDPVGRQVTLGGLRFRVIGVLERVGGGGSPFGPDQDRAALVPVSLAPRLFGTDRLDAVFVRSASTAAIETDRVVVERLLSERLAAEDFSVVSQDEIIGVVGDILGILTLVLGAIAGISLLVGGVGVSNIMLVSVSERTREIGLRKALGARTRDITWQFLVEALVLTVVGGLVGLGLGVAAAQVVAALAPVPAEVTAWSVWLALGVSVAVGLVFGVWPARRAGRMDPVEALRRD